jgi:ATP/maltotriose-dependent transcriptional regulator MalT
MAGHVDEATPLLHRALELNEKLKGMTHDDLVPPLNSLAMIDAYNGRLAEARAEIQRAQQIARLPDHGKLLDQVLLNDAEIALREGNGEQAGVSLAESRRMLEAAFPLAKHPAEAWRYAVWNTVNAELLARKGNATDARSAIDGALPVIAKRFGSGGFYSLLAQRRSQFVEDQLKRSAKST